MEKLETELDVMVRRVEAVQAERKLTPTRLVNEYPDLGSAKTWTDRLQTRRWGELNVQRWHERLTRVMAILDGGVPDENYFTDLEFHRQMIARLMLLERQTNDRRILVCLAPNGCGKSAFARWSVAHSFSTRAMVRMRPSFRNKPIHIYRGIGRALGREISTSNVAEAEESVIADLNSQPRTLFLDQGHEAGVALMHILRALVDETKSRFVYLAYDTAYRQVMTQGSDALIEAQAFIGRCQKPIFDLYKAGTRAQDVKTYLMVMAGQSSAAASSLAAELLPALNARNNLRLLDDAIGAAAAADGCDDPEPETIKSKVYELAGLSPRQFALEKEES